MAWAVLLAWGVQAGSGASFGAVTFFYDHEFPDLHTTALVALIIKVSCAAAGFMLAAWYLKRERDYDVNMRRRVWGVLTLLAALALSSAAFLRWFA